MSKKEINITQLRPGMFVTAIDISWINSPFLSHSMRIKDGVDIERLQKSGVKTVTIDTSRGTDICADICADSGETQDNHSSSLTEILAENASAKSGNNQEGNNFNEPTTTMEEELVVAGELQTRSYTIANETNEKVKKNKPINASPITPIIAETLKSLTRNDQAILSLLHLESSNEKLLAHLFNVFSLTLALSLRMNLSEEDKESLGLASFVHDAAWAKLPLNLFGLGRRYSSPEDRLVKKHIDIICSLLSQSDGFSPSTVNVIREHHERNDGTGYPLGLVADQITKMGKILAVADCYDELIHGLAGHPGMLPNNALSYLYHEGQNGKFDAEVVAHLVSVIGVYPLHSAVLLSSGDKGLVVENNRRDPVRPKVKIFYKATGMRTTAPRIVDLAAPNPTDEGITIKNIVDPRAPGVDPFQVLT